MKSNFGEHAIITFWIIVQNKPKMRAKMNILILPRTKLFYFFFFKNGNVTSQAYGYSEKNEIFSLQLQNKLRQRRPDDCVSRGLVALWRTWSLPTRSCICCLRRKIALIHFWSWSWQWSYLGSLWKSIKN